MDAIHKGFSPLINYSLKHKLAVSLSAVAIFIFSIFMFTRLGGEFIPQLEEGDLAAGVMTSTGRITFAHNRNSNKS